MDQQHPIDVSVDFCGIHMKNPLIVAAGPPGSTGERIRDITVPRADPGAVETKIMFSRVLPYFSQYVSPAMAWSYSKVGGRPGESFPTEGYTLLPGGPGIKRTVEEWLEHDFRIATEPGVPVFVNGPSPATDPGVLAAYGSTVDREIERVAEFALKFQELGAAAVQAPFHALHVQGYGWHNWRHMPRLLRSLKDVLTIPVMVKLPYHPDIAAVVRQVVDNGADAVILTGIGGLLDIDIEAGRTVRPVPTLSDTMTGAILKPQALHCVAACRSAGITVPLIASGGVFGARDVIAYIMAGATAVHMLTNAVLRGLATFRIVNHEIVSWLRNRGYRSLNDIRGAALRPWEPRELNQLNQIRVEVDLERCDGCGLCVRHCFELLHGAISIQDRKARIDAEKCLHCTTCSVVCPPDKAAITVKGWPE